MLESEGAPPWVAIVGNYVFKPENVQHVLGLMRDAMVVTREENGCLHFAFSVDLLNPNAVHLIELWRDESAFANHLKTAQFQAFRAGLAEFQFERTLRRGTFAPG